MLPKQVNNQVLLAVGGVLAVVFVYSVFMRKNQFPCNCPKCQETAMVDAIQGAAFPEIGMQEEGTPAFVTFLYSILALFVIAGFVAFMARMSGKGFARIKKRLPKGKRYGF